MITINNLTFPKDERNSLIRLQLDATNLVDRLQKANKCVLKASEKDAVMLQMAAEVIKNSIDLIPLKHAYRIRLDRKVAQRDEFGAIKKFKSGKKAGQTKYRRVTPADYYSWDHIVYDGVYQPKEIKTHKRKVEKFTSEYSETETRYRVKVTGNVDVTTKRFGTRKKQISLVFGERLTTTKSEKHPNKNIYYTGEGTITVGSKKKVGKYVKRKKVMWENIGEAPASSTVYGKYFATDPDTGKQVMDRPPHLRDVGSNYIDGSHLVTISKHKANIRISSRKPKDKRFYEEGGVNYAYYQYEGDDTTWKRETDGTTSRWLEVSLGLVKSKRADVTVNSEANYNRMKNILQKYIEETLRINGVIK